MMRACTSLIFTGLAAACATSGESLRNDRLRQLDRIADKCGLPRSMFTLTGTRDLRFDPPTDAKYEALQCTFRELNMVKNSFDFVGGEVVE